MKALQDLDLSKITNVLRSLETAAPGASLPFGTHPAFVHPPIPTPVGQVPPSAQSILASGTQPLLAVSEGFTSGDHAYMLANKWLSTTQLAELVKSQGLVYKKGKFSVLEEQQLNSAIEQYCQSKGLSEDQLHDIIFPKDERNRENAFWSEITSAVPQRPIIAVYHHVRRSHHPLRLQGKWTPEEDSRLRTAVMHYGQQWQKVSADVGRGGADCRDRYRNHIVNKDTRVFGSWSKEEEENLTRIVTEMTLEQGRDADNDIFWGVVAQKMGGKRTRAQCRIKWTDSLNLSRKNDGQKPRWGNQDAYILVHKLDALQIVDDTEIDWKTIPDAQWNVWSPHVLQRRWQTMKKSIRGHEYMTHREIMDILKVKKVNSGPSNSSKKRTRKVTSATAIAEGEGRPKE
ncbi:hypothetical protein BDZ89DRAFT_937914 [Hymenopellis radicata]|nr:hypothetical protein BDZ89DRAFT_937914 [Hymenopellis radicata]